MRRLLDSERTNRTDAQRDLAAAKAEVTAANKQAEDALSCAQYKRGANE